MFGQCNKLTCLIIIICSLAPYCHRTECSLMQPFKANNASEDLELFENFLNDELNREMISLTLCKRNNDDIEDLLSDMAVKLEQATSGPYGRRLLNGIRVATNFSDFVQQSTNLKPFSWISLTTGPVADKVLSRSFSLADILSNESPQNPHVVQKSLNIKMESLVNEAVMRLPERQQIRLLQAIEEVYGPEGQDGASNSTFTTNTAKPRTKRSPKKFADDVKSGFQKVIKFGPKAIALLIKRVARVGLRVLDHLYMAPEFVHRLPGIGMHIMELRRKSEPLHRIVEFSRHMHYLYKVAQPASTGDAPADHDPVKVDQAKRMVGEIGVEAMRRVAMKLGSIYLKSRLNDNDVDEFVERTSFAMLSFVLPKKLFSCE